MEWIPANQEFKEDKDIYNMDIIEEYEDNDAISSTEAAFMAGYLES